MDKKNQTEKMLQLPIFQLVGGTQALRSEFFEKLKKGLDAYQLDVGVGPKYLSRRFELISLVRRYDLVIVDGTVDFPLHKIHLDSSNHDSMEDLVWEVDNDVSMDKLTIAILKKLEHIGRKVPVWACILIGGRSSRMGQPKHLIKRGVHSDESWLEHAVRLVAPHVDGLVLSGKGEVPDSLAGVQRIPDIPGVAGPLTGVLSAMRWQPDASWLVIACDMPFISDAALKWLLSDRRPGCWGRLPRLADADFCEPLFAWYDGRGAHLLEEQLLSGNLRVGKIASHSKIDNPIIPETLCSAWENVNTPEQLQNTLPSIQLS